ncbi:serine/threonine-protein kinase [Protofrankia sp. BMG5.30]|uniref:serine/threonine-protein kinase n=1 Tax=Protofrankia sp. BMG5.30 TaxID=1834514 RepID=UPI000977A54B|nr:serine/threonine-protein kinase [Protofrankia sp. BMG5.30]ONH37715.1 hypothetical protein BL254_02165 [Protofrankia sp. BMG5.30]
MAVDRARVAAALPDYDVGDELGRGGFGVVFAGRHKLIQRDVAVKVLPEEDGGAEEVRERFLVEARLLAGFDHPHVVRVYDYVERGGLCLLVMEKLTGGSLRQRFATGPDGRQRRGTGPSEPGGPGGSNQPAACAIGLSAATALAAAHARGVLHRDVKPDNLLFTDAGLPKVTDFGIAKILEATATTTTGLVGTPRYMAPEQISGDRLSPATDLYALGLVLYELLAGRPPFERHLSVPAMLHHHLNVPPAQLTEAPEPVAAVIGRALEKSPPARHSSAQEFAIDLARAAASAYGPGWLTASRVPTSLPDAVTAAARGDAVATPRSPAQSRPATTRPWWSASGAAAGTDTGTDGDTTRLVTPDSPPVSAADPAAGWPDGRVPARAAWQPAGQPRGGPSPEPPDGRPSNSFTAPTRTPPPGPLDGWPAGGGERGLEYPEAHGSGARGSGARRVAALFGPRRNRIGAGVLVLVLIAVVLVTVSRGGSSPRPGRAAYSGPAIAGALSSVNGIAVGADGTIVVSDGSAGRVLTLSPTGTVEWLAGSRPPSPRPTAGASAQPTADTDARRRVLASPGSVAVDTTGVIYVATSTSDGQIFRITRDGGISVVAGSGPELDGFTGNNGAATAAELSQPRGIAVDDNGDVLFSEGTRVRKVTVATGRIAAVAGSSTSGTSGDNGPAADALLSVPTDVVIARDGSIYILDGEAETVRKITPKGVISRFAGTAPPAAGTAGTASPTPTASPPPVGSAGDGSPATAVTLGDPDGIALAPNGDLYIADYSNNVIRLVDAATGVISTFAGSRTATEPGDGGDAREARVYAPTGIAVDGTGAVYIAQYGGIVRRVGPDGLISTILKPS